MRGCVLALGVAAIVASTGVPALAQNLVDNPGFEADDSVFGTEGTSFLVYPYPSGWTQTGNVGVVDTFSNSGQASAQLADGSLSQMLSTTPGVTYTISFYVGVDDGGLGTDPNAIFDASFGGTDLLQGDSILVPDGVTGQDVGPAVGNDAFEEFTDQLVASGPSTTLIFTGNISAGDGPWYLDDVSVQPLVTAAPEPSAALLLLPALAIIGLVRRRQA